MRSSAKRITISMHGIKAVATLTRTPVCQLVTRKSLKHLLTIAPAPSTWFATTAFQFSGCVAMDCNTMHRRVVVTSLNMWTVWIMSVWGYPNPPIYSFYPARPHAVNTIFVPMACQRTTRVRQDCILAQIVIVATIQRKPSVRWVSLLYDCKIYDVRFSLDSCSKAQHSTISPFAAAKGRCRLSNSRGALLCPQEASGCVQLLCEWSRSHLGLHTRLVVRS